MGLLEHIANAVTRRRGAVVRPVLGRIIQPRKEDYWRDYPADGLTPSRLVSILREADAGSLDAAMELFEQMEEKDAHLHSVANTRRLGLSGLEWQVISAAEIREGIDRAAADEAAAYCRESLAAIDRWEEALQHLSLAIGRNVAVAELVWEVSGGGHRLVDVVGVDFSRLTFDDLGRLRILTDAARVSGIALPPKKFIVHTPHAASGHPMRGGLMRVSGLAWLGKHFAMKDWLVFAEVFGMPVRIARYEPSATAEEKRELLRMLQSLGSDAAGIFSKAIELEVVQANQGSPVPPFQSICEFMNREMSKAWLGQTLTTDTGGQTGTFSTAEIHNRVRLDLREDDIRKEGRTIRRDVLRPLVELKFGRGTPVPYFRRKLDRPRDLRELADVVSAAVNSLGMRVPTRWAHETLGIPEAAAGEAVLASRSSE
jgi:phage gp29-like protein